METLRAANDLCACMSARSGAGFATQMLYELHEQRSLEMHREVLEMCRDALGGVHPLTLTAMNNMGNALHTVGMRLVAEETPEDPPEGRAAAGQAALKESSALLRESLERSKEVLGATHIDTLVTASNMAALLQHQGELDEAAALVREAIEGVSEAKKAMGDAHPHARELLEELEC